MGKLTRAYEAAEARKLAALDLNPDDGSQLVFTGKDQARAILSGFDIDFDEFESLTRRAAQFFAMSAVRNVPIAAATEMAWTDGFLIGVFLGKMLDDGTGSDT